jgi:hemoglobin
MNSRDINNREDIYTLVSTFYNKVKEDDFIGPIFLGVIPDEQWEPHLQKLTDFWQTNLFFVRKFKGNPMKAHKDVDKKFNHSISQDHFDRWLTLWYATVDDLFSGTKADEAKGRARNIAGILLIKIFQSRPTQINQ